MATPDELETYLDTVAQRPLEMEQDGRRARSHSIRDYLAYLRFKKGLETSDSQTTSADGYLNLGVRTCRIEPGGSA